MRVVVLTGPESAGKSTLCSALAARFQAPVVREYVREYMELHRRDTCLADITPIAQMQWQREQAARALRPPLLLLDTHLLSNQLWSQTLFGSAPPWIAATLAQARYDAVFLLAPEGLPWQADGQRCQPDLGARQAFYRALQTELERLGQPWQAVTGNWQQRYDWLEQRITALLAPATGHPAPSTR